MDNLVYSKILCPKCRSRIGEVSINNVVNGTEGSYHQLDLGILNAVIENKIDNKCYRCKSTFTNVLMSNHFSLCACKIYNDKFTS